MKLIERETNDLPVSQQSELLSLNRTSLYYAPTLPSAEEVQLKHRIDEIYTAHPFYGSRRITVELQDEGHEINRKRVQRLMREMGLCGIAPGPNLSKRNFEHRVYPYLLRGVEATHPNHIWGIDITYVRMVRWWMYLVAIIDWYSRYIVSWELSDTLEIEFVLVAVDRALGQARPEIWNSDQGSHFTSPQYIERLEAAGVQISMDGRGRALDNIFTERFWRSVKYEEVYLNDYTSPREARHGIGGYMEFYNKRRPHQSLEYRRPAELYFGMSDKTRRTITKKKGGETTLKEAQILS